MKQPKRLTRNQKILVTGQKDEHGRNVNPKSWMLESEDKEYLYLVSKTGKKRKRIKKKPR